MDGVTKERYLRESSTPVVHGKVKEFCFCGVYDYIIHVFDKKRALWLQPGCFLIFHQIQAQIFLNSKASSDNNNPGWTIELQEKGCFVRNLIDFNSIFNLV